MRSSGMHSRLAAQQMLIRQEKLPVLMGACRLGHYSV